MGRVRPRERISRQSISSRVARDELTETGKKFRKGLIIQYL